LIVYEKFKELSEESITLFELLNGTNWNSVRLKIPINDDIGWRVEFRTMEVQLTPHENAAFSLLIHFFTRALHLDKIVNLYIPMSLVLENFDRAHTKNAVLKEKFYFRTNIFDSG
jgi:glutamate--cysteine ligase catalytic subunit